MPIREYFETFGVVEVQQTFYEPPQRATMLRWREQAGSDFEFTMKAWQLVTHRSTSSTYRRLRTALGKRELEEAGSFRPTAIVRRGWEVSLECARLLRATAILFQCPASFRPEPENLASMRSFFGGIERPASPFGGSTLITSAPKSASIFAHGGPARPWLRSSTFKSSSAAGSIIVRGSRASAMGSVPTCGRRALQSLQR
jgi:uncharacterized protein YecE (DUF72 family)